MDKKDYLLWAMSLGIIGLGYMLQQFWKHDGLVLPNRPLIIGVILAIITGGLMVEGLSTPWGE